tara:strand:+ start:1256 stop:2083 length:828 start_codon:yes stop_codon:yes gene_type:complete
MAKNYNDYPIAATNNAKKALRWKKEYGDEVKGGTIVGWTRANQLASRESLSATTVARMASFARHRKNSSIDPKYAATPWKDRGYVAWLIWGGTAGVDWAIRKMEEIRKMLAHKRPQDKGMIDGIIDMLLQIKDLDNRLEIALTQLKLFKKDGIPVDEEEFLKAVKVWSQELKKDKKEDEDKYGFKKTKSPCWDGYRQDGYKIGSTGKRVPNCVKIKYEEEQLKEIDGEVVYETKEEAIFAAKQKGCKGYHEHIEDGKTWYMPCESHDQIKSTENE